MAQLLYERHSTDFHLNAGKRHVRLCRQTKGGEIYATRIEIYIKDLEEKKGLTEKAKLEKEIAYDNVLLADSNLDDTMRTLFERCKQYDRDTPGRPVLNQIFTDGKVSTIIYASLEAEPDLVEQLLGRIAALGANHPLNELSNTIKTNTETCKAALQTYQNAIKTQKSDEAVEEISKSNLRRQYELNYFDIAKEFGKSRANKFFPVIGTTSKSNHAEDTNQDDSGTKQ